jgi:hypothetical protein
MGRDDEAFGPTDFSNQRLEFCRGVAGAFQVFDDLARHDGSDLSPKRAGRPKPMPAPWVEAAINPTALKARSNQPPAPTAPLSIQAPPTLGRLKFCFHRIHRIHRSITLFLAFMLHWPGAATFSQRRRRRRPGAFPPEPRRFPRFSLRPRSGAFRTIQDHSSPFKAKIFVGPAQKPPPAPIRPAASPEEAATKSQARPSGVVQSLRGRFSGPDNSALKKSECAQPWPAAPNSFDIHGGNRQESRASS